MYTRTELPNGLRVVTAPIDSAKSVAVMVMVAAGSRYETRETSGIAHFSEHMFFKGTKKRPSAKDISAEVDGIGGEFNAFTGKEYTGFYIKCAAEHRTLALDVLSDQLLASRFDPEEIEREKGVIVEELNMYLDTPRDRVDSVYETLLFGDQPLGWDIIGTKDTIRGAERQTFLDYLDHWYTPRRLVVGAAGAVDETFADEVAAAFGHLEDRESGAPSPVEITGNGSGPRVSLEHRDSDQAHLRLGVRGIATQDADRYADAGDDRRARWRDVVTALHRGAGAPRPGLLHLRLPPGLRRRRHPVLAGRRRHRADRPGGRGDRARAPAPGGGAGRAATSCAGARTTSRAAWCCSSRIRAG